MVSTRLDIVITQAMDDMVAGVLDMGVDRLPGALDVFVADPVDYVSVFHR